MSRPLLYIIGPSGSGKTTALKLALGNLPYEQERKPLLHMAYASGAIQLGAEREPFGGTDALPMHANPAAIAFAQETDAPALIGEGDRLANRRFFMGALEAGWELTIAYIDVSEEIARQRRDARGSEYSQSWAKGRHTKARNIAEEWGRFIWRLDGRRSPEELAARLRAHPAIQIARGGA